MVFGADVRSAFPRVNLLKAVGLDGVPSHVLGTREVKQAELFTDVFNLSLLSSEVLTCRNKATIISVPKKRGLTCLNDYHLVSLASAIMNCFESLVLMHINPSLTDSLHPLQFNYFCHRFKADAISLALHSSQEQRDNKDTHARLVY